MQKATNPWVGFFAGADVIHKYSTVQLCMHTVEYFTVLFSLFSI